MSDQQKTKKQLINELNELRQRVTELDESKSEWMQGLEELMERSLDSIMFTETVGYVTKVNKHFLEMLGYCEEEVVGKFVAELTPTSEGETYESVSGELVTIDREFLDKTQQLIEELLTKGKVINWEAYYLRKDNKVVPIEQNIVCLYDQEGERTGAVSIIRDISGRKRAEKELTQYRNDLESLVNERAEKLREANDYLDNIINSSLDSILIGDATGNIVRFNQSFLKLIGYEQEEIEGKHFVELSITKEGTYESTTGELVEINEDFFNQGQTVIYKTLFEEGRVTNWESYYLRKDGKIVPIEMSVAYLYGKEGEIIGSVAITRDITGRKIAEKELKEAKEFLENIFKTTTDGILINDHEGIITSINDATEDILGYSREELIGKGTPIFTPGGGEHALAAKAFVEKLFEEGTVRGVELVWQKKDGNLVDVELNAALLKDSKGNIANSVSSIRDITVRKRQEEELKKANDELEKRVDERTSQLMQAKEEAEASNRAKSDFLANMSHELRTPLNHIIGFTEIVVDKRCGELSESQEEYLSDVLKSSRHLLSLINDILDLSKVEAGKFELKPTKIDSRFFLDNCLIMFKEKAMKHDIELTSSIDHIPDTITVDERKMKQIVYNILANAMKFTPDGGRVSLSAQSVDCIIRPGLRSGDPKGLEIISGGNGKGNSKGGKQRKCLKLSFADSGIGIDPEDQRRIFDPFEQADGSSSRKYQGTGLGLPLTKKLVELHGGRMWVESEGIGKGATFSFIIPV